MIEFELTPESWRIPVPELSRSPCLWQGLQCKTSLLASGLCQAVDMAKKRTKADRLQRQAEQLQKRVDRRPDEIDQKKPTREDSNQAAAQTVREPTVGR